MEQKSIKCGTLCPYFKPRKGEYKPRGVCGLPSAPKYVIIDGEREEPPKWCLRKEVDDTLSADSLDHLEVTQNDS